MTREEMLLEYLARKEKLFAMPQIKWKYGKRGITVREATEVLGTTELRKIISTLRRKGFKVITVWEKEENRFGHPVRFKRYFVEQSASERQKRIAKLAGFVS